MNFKEVKNIVDGFTELAKDTVGLVDEETKEMAVKRFRHCVSCTVRTNSVCDQYKEGINIETGESTFGCGCILNAKTLAKDSECPLKKW